MQESDHRARRLQEDFSANESDLSGNNHGKALKDTEGSSSTLKTHRVCVTVFRRARRVWRILHEEAAKVMV